MSKICGYSCEHNKSGVCQISGCDKKSIILDYTIVPNSDIKPLLDKLEKENKILRENAENNDKVVDKVNWENMLLKKENERLKYNWNELKEDLIKIRQLTFTKYNKNEWENCLSFNDDILPLIEKMQEIEQGSDNNE